VSLVSQPCPLERLLKGPRGTGLPQCGFVVHSSYFEDYILLHCLKAAFRSGEVAPSGCRFHMLLFRGEAAPASASEEPPSPPGPVSLV
jgi:hypothetical protein